MKDDNRLRVSVEVFLDSTPTTPLIWVLILLTELRNRDKKAFDIAVKALLESES